MEGQSSMSCTEALYLSSKEPNHLSNLGICGHPFLVVCLGIDVRGLLHFPVPESSWLKHPSASEGKLEAFKSLESGARFSKFSTAWGCPTSDFDVPQTFIQWFLQMHTEILERILFIMIFF